MAGSTANAGPGSGGLANLPARPAAIGTLADGTVYFAPQGAVVANGDLVLCHLCGRWRRSVTAHLRAHGWTKAAYCETFGLERGQSLEGASTRKKRAVAFSARLVFEPALRAGSERGRERARSGTLTLAAAAAARGRRLPEQRRQKARQALAARPYTASADANSARAARHVASVAAAAARARGFADIGALVRARTAQGASLASISREAGLHKDWLSRHLASLDPAAAAIARARPDRADARWLPVIGALGYASVADYLQDRHGRKHRTVNQIAAEVGLSYHTVEAALHRHRLAKVAHAAKRHAARRREAQVAADVGYPCVGAYVAERRAAGWTWSAIATEAGEPQTWLRRQLQRGQVEDLRVLGTRSAPRQYLAPTKSSSRATVSRRADGDSVRCAPGGTRTHTARILRPRTLPNWSTGAGLGGQG
jgi:hypothetical protein